MNAERARCYAMLCSWLSYDAQTDMPVEEMVDTTVVCMLAEVFDKDRMDVANDIDGYRRHTH